MSRRRSFMSATLFALLCPTALGSCADDSVSLRIVCPIAPEESDGTCEYDPGGACRTFGRINLSARSSYESVLRVTNGLKPRNRDVPPLSEPNGVQIYEMEVELHDSAGRKPNLGGLPNPYTVPATGFAEPGADTAVAALLIPEPYIRRILMNQNSANALGTIRLEIIARGETSGGVEVESRPWPWNIQIYQLSPIEGEGECVAVEDNVCGVGQDDFAGVCFQTGE